MNFKKIQNKFWARKASGEEGFTLVELIVVIAILGILAGVGTVAYSGYIKKANMTADQTLVSEVARALELGYYGETFNENGYVMLSVTDSPSLASGTISSANIEKCLIDAFGSDLNNLKLKYSDWNADYTNSSFAGNEADMLGVVDTLTYVLENVINTNSTLVGAQFGSYLESNGLGDATSAEKADAAVLYVAQATNDLNDESRVIYLNSVANFMNEGASRSMTNILTAYNTSHVGGLTAVYALAEGYFQYEAANGKTDGLTELHNRINAISPATVTTRDEATNAVIDAITTAMNSADPTLAQKYFGGDMNSQAVKDAEAYLGIMKTVNTAEDSLLTNLGAEDCFSNANVMNLLSSYSNGGIIVTVTIDNGTLLVSNPITE